MSKVQLLRSTTSGHVPAPGGILPGELALNIPDKRLFAGDGASSPIDINAAILNSTALTGLSLATATPVTAADAVLTAVGKIQAQITRLAVNVVALGADPTGVANSAAAIRSAFGSNRVIVLPPGTYRLASTQTAPPAAFDDACLLAQSFTNFTIMGFGATLIVDNAVALSSALHLDRCTHFQVYGLTIQGSRSGLTSGQENAAVTVSSCTDYLISTLHFTGNFGGQGAGLVGDWLVNGVFENIEMDAVGQMADVAFCLNVTFRGVRGRGADTNGLSGAGQIGSKGISIINDVPNAATNNTGVVFTKSSGILITDCSATNFSTGCYITSGTDVVLTGNLWNDNPGLGGSLGIGVLISYSPSGSFSSVGVPPGNILINGDRFVHNGAVTAGGGVLIDPISIANSDLLSDITIANCLFDNNNSTGINASSAAHLANINLVNNTYSGALQTTPIVSGLEVVASYSTTPTTMRIPGTLVLRNNKALQMLDASGNQQNILALSASNITFIRPGSALAYTEIERFDGTPVLRLTNEATNPTYLAVNGALKNVLVGAADSGGTGYRMLVVAN